MSFLTSLETQSGKIVDESSLIGKLVVLYFSSSWCGACRTFTPLLSVLHEEAHEEGKPFEVVYVSSDDTSEQCNEYMKQKHGDWLRVPFDSILRNHLKETFGVFAGKEKSQFPSVERRSGIPTLVVISRDGQELALLDCDDSKIIQEVEAKGTAFLDKWDQFKW